ncbi:MAG TPA: hypothetical protein VFV95_15790 [Vicinamibacterales bacterium]|nr:hypothetical protein [Vicinamibacterales bacterium]
MRSAVAGVVVAVVVLVAAGWLFQNAITGRSSARQADQPARTADGRPDLNGIWQALNTANFDIQAHAARPAQAVIPAAPRSGVAGLVRATHVELPHPLVRPLGAVGGVPAGESVVEGDEIPYQPWAAAKKKENAEHWLERDPEIKCYMPGVPRATYMPYPFQILQGTNTIVMAYEFAGASRTIHLGTVSDSPAPTWMGWSRGRWEGDSLVVEVTDFNEETWFDRAGNFHSDQLHVTERYTPTSAIICSTRPRSPTRTCSRARGRSACRCTGGSNRARSFSSTSAWSSSRS